MMRNQQADQQARPDDERQGDQGASRDIHENPVGACWRRAVCERFRQRERLVAHVLQRSRIERVDIVARRMIARFVADRREVERQPPPLGETVHVGIVGHQPVDVGRERVGDRPLHRR
jgi:hypothetical protein